MSRFVIVVALLLSPATGLWAICPPARSSADDMADECQRICARHHSEKTCSMLGDEAIMWPTTGVGVALLPAAASDPQITPAIARHVDHATSVLRDLTLAPLLPPPKA